MSLRGALDVLHPTGHAARYLVVGGPAREQEPSATGEVDLLLLAPAPEEARSRAWVERAAATCASRLAADGLVYVIAPRGGGSLRRALESAGLRFECAFVHLPDAASSALLVPLERIPAEYVLRRLAPLPTRRRLLALAALRLPGQEAILRLAGRDVGRAYRRPGAPRLLAWLDRVAGGRGAGTVVGSSSRKPDTARVHVLGRPPRIVHVASRPLTGGDDEVRRSAAAAGVATPRLLADERVGGRVATVETALPGTLVAAHLAGRPDRLDRIAGLVADWLACWSAATAVRARPQPDSLTASAEALRIELPGPYRAYLDELCDRMAGSELPLVAAHDDLTMWNVVVDDDGRLGVVDWETARSRALPLTDFLYAVVDARAAVDRYANRPTAFRASFLEPGGWGRTVERLGRGIAAAVEAPREAVELGFHACWLHHAANESRAPAGPDRPFLEIVRLLASERDSLAGWIRGEHR